MPDKLFTDREQRDAAVWVNPPPRLPFTRLLAKRPLDKLPAPAIIDAVIGGI